MYPSLKQRYLSSFIDGMVLLFAVVVGTIVYQGENQTAHIMRVGLLFVLIVSYEPILTSQLCTFGQRMIGIRVRRRSDHSRKISILAAYFRTIVKVLLGAYSLFAMGLNKERRAAHDFAVGSVVVEVAGSHSRTPSKLNGRGHR
jgi:uncharacterized RDD family membrane protein YckC